MSQHSVLIIEDDEALLRGLQDNFRAQGYRVRTARNGSEGLCAALSETHDLILLDIMLPRMNGYEICRQLRQNDTETTIIMLTAKGQEDDIIRGLDLGADDYVTKPFSIRELLARVKAFLRRKDSEPVDIIEFGDCRLDLAAHKLFKNGAETELTTKEFRLLKYLVSRAGRALTRHEILEAVWGNSIIVTARSVDRCVATLRGKLESEPARPRYIRTIRDVGYRFDDGISSD